MQFKISPFEQNRQYLENQYREANYSESTGLCGKELLPLVKKAYFEASDNLIGTGNALKLFFENVRICINPHDIFANLAETDAVPARFSVPLLYKLKEHIPLHEAITNEGAIVANHDFGHTMPDWNTIIEYGLTGIAERANKALEKTGLSEAQRNYYNSVKLAYEGIISFVERLCDAAKKTDGENAAFCAHNLGEIAKHPPRTLPEVMQLYFIMYFAQQNVEGETVRSLGALDVLLYPFYESDIKSGRYSEEQIREFIKYFLIKWYAVKYQANIPFNLCEQTNRMTYLILEEYIALGLHDPKIHVKCHEKTPEKVYEMILDSVRNGKNSFVFINDKIVKKALINVGQDAQDVNDYVLIGCYEPASMGKEVPCTCSGRINMPLAVEVVLNGGKRFNGERSIVAEGVIKGKACKYEDFEAFYEDVKAVLNHWAKVCVEEINGIERLYPKVRRSPIFSATYKESFERGIDLYEGGAKYNNSSISAFGIGTITDELYAIKKAVFEDKLITLSELCNVLKNNWENAAALRKKFIDYPKYGNNNAEVDSIAVDVFNYMASVINNVPNGRGGVYRYGTFSIDWRMEHGKMTGASADGRFSGEPVSKNMCASVGMDKSGITGVINSATVFDYTHVPNGTVLDIALHPTAVSGNDGMTVLKGLVKTFLSKGGFALQINIVSAETLKKAKAQPEKYRNLQVRLCGWNVYFTNLSEAAQDDLIKSIEDN